MAPLNRERTLIRKWNKFQILFLRALLSLSLSPPLFSFVSNKCVFGELKRRMINVLQAKTVLHACAEIVCSGARIAAMRFPRGGKRVRCRGAAMHKRTER